MPLLLLVEGPDDQHLIRNVAKDHGVDVDLQEIRVCGGIERLLHEVLPVALKSSAPSVVVILDADHDLQARWNAVAHQLTVAGYEAPKSPSADGLILTGRRPVVGVWLMPDNLVPGALEDFATHLIPPTDPLWPRAVDVVEEIPPSERRFTAIRKAEIHTYLAWQEEPGTPLGLAVTKKYFQTDVELCHRFVQWLKQLKELT